MNRPSYVSDNDTLVLEDDSGRIKLLGDNLDVGSLVTGKASSLSLSQHYLHCSHMIPGMVVAVKGVELPGGEFQVEELVLPGIPPQPLRIGMICSSVRAQCLTTFSPSSLII